MNASAIPPIVAGLGLWVSILAAADSPKAAPVQVVPHDTSGWFPFEFPLDDTNLDSIDLSGLLDAPAAKHGFVTTRPDGHFYFANGKRARFFGTNVVGLGCAPAKEQAPVTAARVYALDSTGRRGRQLDARSAAGIIEFDPASAASIWCELVSP